MCSAGVKFSPKIENNILNCIEKPFVLKNLLNKSDLDYIEEEKNRATKIVKNSNIINLKYEKGGTLESWILEKLKSNLGPVKRHGGSYVISSEPFHVHTDSGKNEEMDERFFPYKNILIPLSNSTELRPLYTVFFKQRSIFEASHFWRGHIQEVKRPCYNHVITDYSQLINYTHENFCHEIHENHLSHLNVSMLHGLSVEEYVHWNIGDVIIFDCSQLHASNNYKTFSGLKESLSMFTSKSL